jgi:hypothetical protein
VVIGALVLTVAACGGGDDSPTTAAAPDGDGSAESTPTEQSTIPLQTVPDEEFTNVVGGLQTQVDQAADSCALLELLYLDGNLPTPSNPAQTKQAIELVSSLLERLGANPPAGQEAAGTTLRDAAKALLAEGEASGWDPSTISDSDVIGADVQTALGGIASACPGLAPAGAPDSSTPG